MDIEEVEMIDEVLSACRAGLWDRPRLRCLAKPERTIFWTLMDDEERRSRTHSSNWVWYHHWMCRRTGKEKKGELTNTMELGRLIQEQGTLEDKIAWGKTIRAIEWETSPKPTTNKGRYIDERF